MIHFTLSPCANAAISQSSPAHRTKQHGFSLLEALIAALVLSIGLLGVAALQANALKNNQSSLERSMAVAQSYSILDAMRANVVAARNNAYNTGGNVCAVPAAGATLATQDINRWITNLQAALNDTAACGNINCAANVCTITVTWSDSRGTQGNAAQTITTVSQL
ncbi:MAG: type IV pilus modification protein PilV [Halothiobacillaceae bacterium]